MRDDRALTIRQLGRKFNARYYLWAKQEAERELDQGFPRVRQVTNLEATRFLEVIEPMSPERKRSLVLALVKRFHKDILNDVGESFSEEEYRIVSAYLAARFKVSSSVPAADRKTLAKQAKAALVPLAGKVTASTGSTWWHEMPINGWVLQTSLDAGAKFEHLAYFHSINSPDNFSLAPNISFLMWLGITGATSWIIGPQRTAADTVQTLAEFCRTFIIVAPSLLEGLPASGSI